MSRLLIEVPGVAQPQGSKTAGVTKGGHPYLRDDNPRLKVWRADVSVIAQNAIQRQHWPGALLGTALGCDLTFYFARPKSNRGVVPTGRPDLDKLCRAIFDALADAGAFGNDSQIVDVRARKRWGVPGVRIGLRILKPEEVAA